MESKPHHHGRGGSRSGRGRGGIGRGGSHSRGGGRGGLYSRGGSHSPGGGRGGSNEPDGDSPSKTYYTEKSRAPGGSRRRGPYTRRGDKRGKSQAQGEGGRGESQSQAEARHGGSHTQREDGQGMQGLEFVTHSSESPVKSGRGRRRGLGSHSKDSYQPTGSSHKKQQPHAAKVERTSASHLTHEQIQELSVSDDHTVAKNITQDVGGFITTFKHKECLANPRILKQLLTILYKLVESRNTQAAVHILSELFAFEEDHALFILHLNKLLKTMQTEKRPYIKDENLRTLYHLSEISKFCVETMPKTVEHTIPVTSIKTTAENLLSHSTSDVTALERIKQSMLKLEHQLRYLSIEEAPAVKSKIQMSSAKVIDQDPPEKFFELPILPLPAEINQPALKPYLRPNIVRGKYHSWDHYLDVQFRLLREDFIGPLRDGISDYLLKFNFKRSKGEIRVYYNVTIQQPVCLAMGIGFEVAFDIGALRRVNWEYTKRLINGSLLCLSTDNFATICFATVAQRDAQQLKDGIVTVKFEGSANGFKLDAQARYTMVESVAYFEAYRHVLEQLRAIGDHKFESMPFQRYIVDSQFDSIPLPQYLNLDISGHTIFNLKGVIQVKSRFVRTKVDLAKLTSWPDAKVTNLDSSQMEALQAALTQEISVIQGPPGTGKTYVGLKIVKAFLANREVWDPKKNTPILVVCYTNHALDQFLEGIRQDEIQGKFPTVTRIGGRCKSEILEECTLKERVSTARKEKTVPFKVFRPYMDARETMQEKKEKVISDIKSLHLSKTKILWLGRLKHIISPQHTTQLNSVSQSDSCNPIEVWLGLQYEGVSNQETIDESPNTSSLSDMQQQPGTVIGSEIVEDGETEVQIVNDDRLVEGNQVDFRPTENTKLEVSDTSKENINDGWQTVQMSEKKKRTLIKKQLSRGLKPMSAEEVQNVQSLWSLSKNQKWRLYLHWKEKYRSSLQQHLFHLSQVYEATCERYQQKRHEVDQEIIKGSDVVGMTTTGAAKHSYIMKSIQPKIVVVEEAAEIFEPHIFTSLSPSVQQLILIGDHKQLRPKPNYYELEKHYDFNISLFERLAINKCPVQTLNIQHRMRPEVASLITPAIYKELKNHESVEKYEHVKGVGKDLFFINHTEPEMAGDDDKKSHSNPYEARYLGALCNFLLKQDYKSTEITILTLYRGQLLEIKKVLRERKIIGVRTVVVDDFQGEENQIILLSLVRSNSEGEIGFLKIENRVCVALSRAKMGLYIIGNKEMLRDKVSTVWPAVIDQLTSTDSIGESLPLHCHKHRDYQVSARLPRDFQKCPEGGCMRKCNTRLRCGHVCPRLCHSYDLDHLEFQCIRICDKQLTCGHKCTCKCYECAEGCLPCKVQVIKTLSECGHSQKCACSDDVSKIECSHICEKVLECGHFCQEKCSEPCSTNCMKKIDKHLPCGHTIQDSCYLKEELVECSEKCSAILDCGHPCPGTCHTCNLGRLHIQCQAQCNRILTCGHECDFRCTPSCPPCSKPCSNFCTHSHCPKMCYEPCAPCMEPCDWSCEHFQCTQPCGMPCDRPPCDQPCQKRLKCGHRCIGLCGELCPELCRICDKETVTESLDFWGNEEDDDARFILLPDCNHIIEVRALDQWMSTEITSDSQEITLNVCPQCKTPVRRCLRYGNDIRSKLNDIEAVKRKLLSSTSLDLPSALTKVREALKKTSSLNSHFIVEELDTLERVIEKSSSVRFPHIVKAQLSFLLQIVLTLEVFSGLEQKYTYISRIERLKRELNHLKDYVMCDTLSQQQLDDAESEMRRIMLFAKFTELQIKLVPNQHQVSQDDNDSIQQTVIELEECGWKREKASEETKKLTLKLIESFCDKYSIDRLSETERLEIVKAIGLKPGHWYKCPNGHIYAIGGCGGAMQRGRCPECKASIGGMSHALAADNDHAPEMDGSRHAAWSDAANMENFDLQDLV